MIFGKIGNPVMTFEEIRQWLCDHPGWSPAIACVDERVFVIGLYGPDARFFSLETMRRVLKGI